MPAAGLPTLPDRRPEPKGEMRRVALLAALEELLRSRPLADVSIGQITTAAGLGRSTFYFYFPSKEAAVSDLLHDVFDEMVRGAQGWIDGSADPRAGIGAALAGTMASWRAHRHLLLAMVDARGGDPAVRDLWDSWVEKFVEPLATAVEREQAAGRATPSASPRTLVRLLLGLNERALEHHARAEPGDAETQELLDALTDVWLVTIYGRLP